MLDKRAADVVKLDMSKTSMLCDYFIIASAESTTKVKTISDAVTRMLKVNKMSRFHVEGAQEGCWVLIDCGDIIVHVFHTQLRSFYDLERLWQDTPKKQYPLNATN